MSLRLRFNIVLTIVFALGLAVSGYLSYDLLQANARDEVVRNANLMIDAARAIRAYTVENVRPKLAPQLNEVFHPETVPALAATEVLSRLPREYKGYAFKEATLNPTNPHDRAADWEADIISTFARDADLKEMHGERDTPNGRALFIAQPIRITNEACLTCHSVPGNAPASMIKLYGDANGFGWKLKEVVGTQLVSVPMSIPQANADRAFLTFMASLCGVFVVLYIVLNVMLGRIIIRPITDMARIADEVSVGNFEISEFAENRSDEVGRLGASFNRMRRSLEQAMGMIGS
jgi:HAMP domain-containing protein